ncbi:unnamed protein product [Cercospora beticola]|nr:unnamed protein product [Cercospora beticola]
MANHNPRTAAGDKRAADTSDSADTITAPPKKLKFIPDDAVGEPLEKDKKSLMKYNTSGSVVGKPTAVPLDSPDISTAQPMNGELDPNTAVGTPIEQKKTRSAVDDFLARVAARKSAARSDDSAELKTAQPRQQQLTPNPAQNTAMNEEV